MTPSSPTPPPAVSPTFDPGFSTRPMTAVFSASAFVGHMLRVEAALARVQSRHGLIPVGSSAAIVEACDSVAVDPEEILAEGWERGTPLLPLLDDLRDRLPEEHARWVHFGATTQDIVDTSSMIQYRSGLELIVDTLRSTESRLRLVADEHRRTPICGRTLLQPAASTTFGLVAAGWAYALHRRRIRLEEVRVRLPVQLGGPVGDLRSLGPKAGAVVDDLAKELDLVASRLPWHTDRHPVFDVVTALAAVDTVLAKVSEDLVLLAGHGEVRMRSTGSSSMPAKRNPFDAVRALAASRAALAAGSAVIAGAPHELQRAVGAWHVEWWAVPMTFHTTGAAAEAVARAVDSLEVDADAMAANLEAAGLDPSVSESTGLLIDRALDQSDEPR